MIIQTQSTANIMASVSQVIPDRLPIVQNMSSGRDLTSATYLRIETRAENRYPTATPVNIMLFVDLPENYTSANTINIVIIANINANIGVRSLQIRFRLRRPL